MTQFDDIQRMDADLHAALADAGMADRGHYTAPGANFDQPCRIYIDRAAQVLGEFGQVVGRRIEMAILAADVDARAKGVVYVPFEGRPGGESFTLVEKVQDDGSLSHWVVRLG